MDIINSAAFRKTYAKLAKPTIVTVSGHAIGMWSPVDHPFPGLDAKQALDELNETRPANRLAARPWASGGAACDCCPDGIHKRANFNSRPFTPVPKKGR